MRFSLTARGARRPDSTIHLLFSESDPVPCLIRWGRSLMIQINSLLGRINSLIMWSREWAFSAIVTYGLSETFLAGANGDRPRRAPVFDGIPANFPVAGNFTHPPSPAE